MLLINHVRLEWLVTEGAGQHASLKCCFSSQRLKVAVLYFFLPKLEGALGIQWWNFSSSIRLEQSTGHLKDIFFFLILKYDKSLLKFDHTVCENVLVTFRVLLLQLCS